MCTMCTRIINAIFQEFAADVAMQIAANPSVVAVSASDVPEATMAAEKAIEIEKTTNNNKQHNST